MSLHGDTVVDQVDHIGSQQNAWLTRQKAKARRGRVNMERKVGAGQNAVTSVGICYVYEDIL